MSTQTNTQTYTQVDVRKVAECLAADLSMLARRTGTQSQEWAKNVAHDITLALVEDCFSEIHIQLLSPPGSLIAVHKYTVIGRGHLDDALHPGGNNWKYDPNNRLDVIVFFKDRSRWEQLKAGGRLRFSWSAFSEKIDYTKMTELRSRQFSRNGYGINRESYIL